MADTVSTEPAVVSNSSPAFLSDSNVSPRIGSWRGLLVLIGSQLLMAVPVFAVAAGLGAAGMGAAGFGVGSADADGATWGHLQQAGLAALIVWPLVIVSYVPLLFWTVSDSAIVPMYLAIMVRMLGTLAAVLFVRQIAAPLVPDSWFAYISAFYLTGLVAETTVAVWHLQSHRPGRGLRVRSEAG